MNSIFWSELFQRRDRYYLIIKDTVPLPSASTTAFGMRSSCFEVLMFRGSILWNSIPGVIKSSEKQSLLFATRIKTWTDVKDATVNNAAYFKYYVFFCI